MAGHEYVATYTATDLNKSAGKVLDDASRGPVEIRRRGTEFVILRSDRLDQMLSEARQDRPRGLADLLRSYDTEKVKAATCDFLNAPPVGKERIWLPRQGDDFARQGYVPRLGDVDHMNWAPALGHEMRGPHYGLVVSDTQYNHGTGLVVLCPITSKMGKLSHFEHPIQAGRISGVAILSEVRSVDYQTRSIQFEDAVSPAVIAEANRRIRMIFP